ncbi:MAG: hypothetical protein JWN50_213 [Parcubacteria group bacterium]|nr:hypothetical protein [Parcubacteria group bacterium]
MSQDIALRLVSGIKNIEQMRKDIKMVVETIMLLAQRELCVWAMQAQWDESIYLTEYLPSPRGGVQRWLLVSKGNSIEPRWNLAFGSEDSYRVWKGGDAHHYFEPGLDDVVNVHSSLSLLVEGMIKQVPSLKARMQPFLVVAEK